MTRYVPLSRRGSSESAAGHMDAMHPGVPPWLRESLWAWLKPHISTTHAGGYRAYVGVRPALLRELERNLEFDSNWDGEYPSVGLDDLKQALYASETVFLDVAEYVAVNHAPAQASRHLDGLLREAGSKWRVSTEGRFEERVPAAVQAAAEAAFGGETAGVLLQRAWNSAFGRNPNPSDAYRHAVRAVEAASKGSVAPADDQATLGKIIAALRDGQAKFDFVFGVNTKVTPIQVLIDMMQLLWTNQYDRHVSEHVGLTVTDEEATAAVMLSLTLVQWFSAGHVRRKA